MHNRLRKLMLSLIVAIFGCLLTISLFADSKTQTFTGEVSDSMCGAKHMMEGSKAECTRACISKGSKYALVVGDKVYTLESGDKTLLEKLNKLAGEQAKISGVATGDSIQVSAVAAAK
ncbi:MAG: hypothetical protein ABJA69_10040 [Acidobacteriaceae bacterium]